MNADLFTSLIWMRMMKPNATSIVSDAVLVVLVLACDSTHPTKAISSVVYDENASVTGALVRVQTTDIR